MKSTRTIYDKIQEREIVLPFIRSRRYKYKTNCLNKLKSIIIHTNIEQLKSKYIDIILKSQVKFQINDNTLYCKYRYTEYYFILDIDKINKIYKQESNNI